MTTDTTTGGPDLPQKRELVTKLLKAKPGASNHAIAKCLSENILNPVSRL